MTRPRYARAPSSTLGQLLLPGGMLAPLLRARQVAGLRLDVHLREGDHVHAYCGLTRVVDASLVGGRVRLAAADTYRSHPNAAGLFRDWALNDPGFAPALDLYLNSVVPATQWTSREGAVQAAWSEVRSPWVPLDREAVIGYPGLTAQASARGASAIAAARAEIERERLAGAWAKLPDQDRAAELDQLAVDPEGRLVLLELKYGKAAEASVYYAPLQLLQYVHEWHRAFTNLRSDLDALRAARIAAQLSPADMPTVAGGLRPVIGFGDIVGSREVMRRLDLVRTIADRHLPAGVMPIELWMMSGGAPQRLS